MHITIEQFWYRACINHNSVSTDTIYIYAVHSLFVSGLTVCCHCTHYYISSRMSLHEEKSNRKWQHSVSINALMRIGAIQYGVRKILPNAQRITKRNECMHSDFYASLFAYYRHGFVLEVRVESGWMVNLKYH